MKKIISLLLSLSLLLSMSAFAFAAEGENPSHSHTLSDIYINTADQNSDLGNIAYQLDVTEGDGPKSARLHMDVDGETTAEIAIAEKDGLYVLHLRSELLEGSRDFVIDPVTMLASVLRGGVDGVVELLQGLDTTALAQSIIDSAKAAADLPAEEEAPAEPEADAAAMPQITFDGDLTAVLENCYSGPETVNMGGISYTGAGEFEMPEGAYEERTLSIDTETVCQILDMVRVDGEPTDLSERVRDAGIELSLVGVTFDGEAASTGDLAGLYGDADGACGFEAGVNRLVTETGASAEYYMSVTKGDDVENMTEGWLAGFTVSEDQLEGAAFTADDVDMDGAVRIGGLDDEQALSELSDALSMVATDMLMPLLAPIMEIAMANVDPTILADLEGLAEE